MRIVIDLQACQSESRFRGIGRYSNALTKALLRQAGGHEVWLALNDRLPERIRAIRADFDGLLPRERIVTFSIPGSVMEAVPENAWRTRTAELLREYFLAGLNPDVVHISSLFEGWAQDYVNSIGTLGQNIPTSATLYDLIPYINQKFYLPSQEIKDHYFRKIESLKKANLLLAISEYTKQEAITALGIKPETIVNISSAIEAHFKMRQFTTNEKLVIFNRYKITQPFIMCAPGGFDERKNLVNLVTAYSKLPDQLRSQYQLVITGKIVQSQSFDQILQRAKAVGLKKKQLIFTDYVGDDDLIALYSLCDLFVFPSLYEGFGLPVLEAMACGAVVIGANRTSIPEIIDRKDALFNPTDPGEITQMMQLALTDEGFRTSFKEYGNQRAQKFSWDNSAKTAIAAFEALHESETNHQSNHKPDPITNYRDVLSKIGNIRTTEIPTKFDLVKTANRISLNGPVSSPRQLLVDISVMINTDHKSGVHRVVRSILLALLESPPQGYKVKPIYFDGQRYRYANHFMTAVLGYHSDQTEDDIINMARADIYLGLDLSAHLHDTISEYLNRLNILGVEIYFVVYDILFAQHPNWFDDALGKSLILWLKSIANVSSGLVCISRSVAVDLLEWLGSNSPNRVEPLPIGFFHLGADIENSLPTQTIPANAAMIQKTMESAPSFITVGLIDPRKGHAQLISAFESLWGQGLDVNLIIVGKIYRDMDGIVDRLRSHPMQGKHLFWLEDISDAYLEKIYQFASASIMPSEGEGFGLPLIEAARHGTSLILRDLPVFREIAGEHACYFTGLAPEALATEIIQWLERNRQGLNPSSSAIQHLSWAESAAQLTDTIMNNKWISKWDPVK